MLHSGGYRRPSGIPGVKVDKHSTGGVGDKTASLWRPWRRPLAWLVPMMSGPRAGHTGGRSTRLESIPAFRTDLTAEESRSNWPN